MHILQHHQMRIQELHIPKLLVRNEVEIIKNKIEQVIIS